MRPALLLLDEPTAGLDPLAEHNLCGVLRELTQNGTTLVVATHAVDLVPHFATRVVLLGEGRVLADGPCREVLSQTELLARARVRRPWPVELWARALAAGSAPGRVAAAHARGNARALGTPLTDTDTARSILGSTQSPGSSMRSSSASSITATPSSLAFSNFVPASSPATT